MINLNKYYHFLKTDSTICLNCYKAMCFQQTRDTFRSCFIPESPFMLLLPGGSDGKGSACNAGGPGSPGSNLGSLGLKIPWRRHGYPFVFYPVFLPGEFHGQRSLAGYSPWGHRELESTEQLTHSTLSSLFHRVSTQNIMVVIITYEKFQFTF